MSHDRRDQPLCRPRAVCWHALTLQPYPDRLCLSRGATRLARHARRYDRHTDVEDPDHPKPLLAQRTKARDHKVCMRFLALIVYWLARPVQGVCGSHLPAASRGRLRWLAFGPASRTAAGLYRRQPGHAQRG